MNTTKTIVLNNKLKKHIMKYLIFCILISSTLYSAPKTEVVSSCSYLLEITDQIPVAEIYYNRLEASKRLPLFVNKYIDRKAKEKPEVSLNIWQTIKDDLDYTSFKNSVIEVLNNNFTIAEMEQIIAEYNGKPYVPILRLKVRNELHLALKEFNKVLLVQINDVLIANNYQSI